MTEKRKPKGGPKRSPSGKGHIGKSKDPPKTAPKQSDMPNRQGDNPSDKDEDDRLPPLVETADDRPPPEPDPKTTIDDDNAWSRVARASRVNRGTDPKAKEQGTLRPVTDRPNTPRPPTTRPGGNFSNRQRSPAETSDDESKFTFKATPDSVKDGWSPSESEEDENVVVTGRLKTEGDLQLTHQEIEKVARNIIFDTMDEQLKSLMASSNNPVPNLMSPIQNLFQLSGTGPTIGQLGGTKTPSPTGDATGSTKPRQDAPIAKGPGIINPPALIKRRMIRDPSLIPEYGAPYVPTPRDNNTGDVERDSDGNPSTHDSTGQEGDTDNTIKTPGIGTDYIAARNQPGGGTGPDTDATGDTVKGNTDPNTDLIPEITQDVPPTGTDDLLAVNTIPTHVTDLDNRLSARINNMSLNISQMFARMGSDHREAVLRADERNFLALTEANERNQASFANIQETLTTQATAIEARAGDQRSHRPACHYISIRWYSRHTTCTPSCKTSAPR
jgi:hypothetical protein